MTRLDGATSWAAIVTAYGVGGVLGGILVRSSAIARRHAALGFLLETPAPLALALGTTTWLVAAMAVVGGIGSAVTTTVLTTSLQLHTPPRLQATTAALHEGVELALLSIGYLAAGAILGHEHTYCPRPRRSNRNRPRGSHSANHTNLTAITARPASLAKLSASQGHSPFPESRILRGDG